MKTCSRIVLAVLSLALCMQARAMNAFSNDVSDLWWNPDESGWGVNVIEQSNILFATLFVYDQNGQAHWYVASDLTSINVPTDRPYEFTGRLYETTGPVFSAASFAASAVTRRDVGTMTFEFIPPYNANLSYSVDGAVVSKHVVRQAWATNNLSGNYFGGQFTIKSPFTPSTCTTKAGLQAFDNITIAHSGSSVTIEAAFGTPPQELCRYTGTYSQSGHMGEVSGAYSCQTGASGTFKLLEVEVGTNGFSSSYSATTNGCTVLGNFSAVRAN